MYSVCLCVRTCVQISAWLMGVDSLLSMMWILGIQLGFSDLVTEAFTSWACIFFLNQLMLDFSADSIYTVENVPVSILLYLAAF